MIPVRNIYHMLAYVFDVLKSQGYRDLSTEDFDNVEDLLAGIIAKGISLQVKCGLMRGYVERTETSSSPRGKIDITSSVKHTTLANRELVYVHDDFSIDTYTNRILKTAGILLLKAPIKLQCKRNLRRALVHLQSVSMLDPYRIDWKQRADRIGQTYLMLLNISRMAIEGSLHVNTKGNMRLEDFVDEKRMCALYERFILEYYRKEHNALLVAEAPYIPWALDGGSDDLLPVMRTDITLRGIRSQSPRTLIIDAKYYSRNTQSHFNHQTIHSAHLYQIFSYVKNEDVRLKRNDVEHVVSGMLLYAKTDEKIQPDAAYLMSGNKIVVKTLDMDLEFKDIALQLDGIAKEYFQKLDCQ